MGIKELNTKRYHFKANDTITLQRWALKCVLLLAWSAVDAQTQDSLTTETEHSFDSQFPSRRPIRMSYETFTKRNFTSKLYDQQLQQGKIKSESRITVEASMPIYKGGNYMVTGSVKYSNDDIQLNNVITAPENSNFPDSSHRNFQYFSTSAGFVYFSTLFNRRVVYNANLITDGDQHGLLRLYGTTTAVLILKSNEQMKISIGLIGFIDPSAIIPVVPSVAVQLRLNSAWEMDVLVPRHILFKRKVLSNSLLSIGAELNSNSYYTRSPGLVPSGHYQFSQLESRTGFTFEQKIQKQFFLSIKAGYLHIFNAKLAPINKPLSDYVYQAKSNATGYFNVGISYFPFQKK